MPQAFYISSALADLSVDVSLSSVARGDLLYRGATKWNNLAHGTTGQFLKTNGVGADPSWGTVDLTTLVTLAPGTVDRNMVQPTDDACHGLVLKGKSVTQTATLLEARTSADAPVFRLQDHDNSDLFCLLTLNQQTSGRPPLTCRAANGNPAFLVSPGSGTLVDLEIQDAGDIGLFITLNAGQTAPAIVVADNSDGETLFEVDASADVVFHRNPTVPDPVKLTGKISSSLLNNVAATYTSQMRFSVTDHTATRTGIDIEADGSEVRTGFNGAAAVARQLLATGAGHTVDDIITALQAVGLLKQA